MESKLKTVVRQPTLLDFSHGEAATAQGLRRWAARGQNFCVTWSQATGDGAGSDIESDDEILLLVHDAPVHIAGAAATATAALSAVAAARSICILPAGAWRLELKPGAVCVVIASLREGKTADALNEAAYAERDARIVPVGSGYKPLLGDGIRVSSIDAIAAPKDKPRLKMFQTATLSINWVEYDGPRERTALSPHSHSAFEQGSLGLSGAFVHHLRVPWTENAETWRKDHHARLDSPSLMVVPVGLIHTSEGVESGHHLLIDVFSPPRADFIAKGWVANAGDYAASATPLN